MFKTNVLVYSFFRTEFLLFADARSFWLYSSSEAEDNINIRIRKEIHLKKKLYLVRHGQTLFNKKRLIQGWCDSPLTEKGHLQANAVKRYLKSVHFVPDHAYCSTLHRTEETLKDITDLPYERKEGLREFHYGDLEGESIREAYGGQGNPDTWYVQFGGESRQEVEDRMYKTLEEIMEDPEAQNVLAIGSGSACFRFASKVDPEKAEKLRKFDNCVIYDFDYEDGKFTLNDIINSHIRVLKDRNNGSDPKAVDM